MIKTFLAALTTAAALAALPALADEVRMSSPVEAGSLHADDVTLVAYYIPLADDGFEVTVTWLGDEDAEANRTVMRLVDGDAVSFSLPGHLGTLLTFTREFDAVTLSAEPVTETLRSASL